MLHVCMCVHIHMYEYLIEISWGHKFNFYNFLKSFLNTMNNIVKKRVYYAKTKIYIDSDG